MQRGTTPAFVGPIGWAVGLVLVLFALAWRVRYANDAAACVDTELLVLCQGPLDAWVLPLTLVVGLALVAIGAWRLLARRH